MKYDCTNCPYNEDMDHGPDRRYPCGQQNCWLELYDGEEVEEDV